MDNAHVRLPNVTPESEQDAANRPYIGGGKAYESLTIGEIMALAVSGGEQMRHKLLRMEEAGKKRDAVVGILRVNWNS